MAYDKKYIEEGNDVGDYLNDREDAIEASFDELSVTSSGVSVVNGTVAEPCRIYRFQNIVFLQGRITDTGGGGTKVADFNPINAPSETKTFLNGSRTINILPNGSIYVYGAGSIVYLNGITYVLD